MATRCSFNSDDLPAMTKTTVIIPAAGRGRRFGDGSLPKQYQLLDGQPILWHTIRAFETCTQVDAIVVAIHPDDTPAFNAIRGDFTKLSPAVHGGQERTDSVRRALDSLPEAGGDEVVLVHDAVRPWVSLALIEAVILTADRHGAAIPALPVTETVKVVAEGVVLESPTRSRLYNAQTPQGFSREILQRAAAAVTDGAPATDEASLVERVGVAVHVIPGEAANVKITTAADLAADSHVAASDELRVGMGYDVHAFAEHRPLILGGVRIPSEHGLLGHSDADVLTHAVIDALLGAARLGDIGRLFPDDDPAFEGIDSLILLDRVRQVLVDAGIGVVNVDATVMAQAPKLSPYVEAMCSAMAAALGVQTTRISVKATTTERLGFVGREEGMAAQATVLLRVPSVAVGD